MAGAAQCSRQERGVLSAVVAEAESGICCYRREMNEVDADCDVFLNDERKNDAGSLPSLDTHDINWENSYNRMD